MAIWIKKYNNKKNKIFNYFDNNRKEQINLFKEVKVDIREIDVNEEEIKKREGFGENLKILRISRR